MAYTHDDPYNNPNSFGLMIVGECDLYQEDWGFNIAVVWYHNQSKQFYLGTDSGCSCPSPFEWIESLSDLSGPYSKAEVLRAVADLSCEDRSEIIKLCEKIRNYTENV